MPFISPGMPPGAWRDGFVGGGREYEPLPEPKRCAREKSLEGEVYRLRCIIDHLERRLEELTPQQPEPPPPPQAPPSATLWSAEGGSRWVYSRCPGVWEVTHRQRSADHVELRKGRAILWVDRETQSSVEARARGEGRVRGLEPVRVLGGDAACSTLGRASETIFRTAPSGPDCG